MVLYKDLNPRLKSIISRISLFDMESIDLRDFAETDEDIQEINKSLKTLEEVKKIMFSLNTNDNEKCDLLDDLLFGESEDG